jgi:AcrR family transcriptional regulator
MGSRQTQILRTAYDIVGNRGIESLHARTVAQEIGVNHATVHYYFPKREDLLVSLANYANEQFQKDRARFLKNSDNPDEQLEAELALAEAYCRKTSRFFRVLVGLYAAAVEYPEVAKQIRTLWETWEKEIHVELDRLVDKKMVNTESPFRDSELLVASLVGLGKAAHIKGQKFKAGEKIDAIFASLFD